MFEQHPIGRPQKTRIAATHRAGHLEHLFHRQPVFCARCVEHTTFRYLGHADDPLCEIARVDDAHAAPGPPWCQHVASPRDTPHPIGEPVHVIVRADNEPWPHVQHAPGHRVFGSLFAQSLEGAIRLAISARHRSFAGRYPFRFFKSLDGDCVEIAALVRACRRVVGIHRHARHECVMSRAIAVDRVHDPLHAARHVATGVDHGIPVAALQGGQIAVPIADELLHS